MQHFTKPAAANPSQLSVFRVLINTSGCHASASLAAVQRASDRASYSRFPSRPGKDTRKWRRSPSLTIELNARTGWKARRQLGCGGSALLHACSPRAVHLQGVSSYILVVNMPYTEAHPLKRPLSCVSRLQLCVQNGSHLRRSAPSELLRALAPPYGNRLRRSARRAGPARLALGAARLRGYLDHWMLRLCSCPGHWSCSEVVATCQPRLPPCR